MTFKDAASIQDAVEQMRLANIPCAENRAKINGLFNGNQPWTEEERQANKIFTNANFLEGPVKGHQAVQQLENALLKPGNFFTITLDSGPQWMRAEWGAILTEELNKCLKRSQEWKDLLSNMARSVVLHGIGPMYWPKRFAPVPVELGIEDVLVPARTLVSMRNLEFFAIYREWTYAELYAMTHGAQVDPGWNMALVNKLLEELAKQPLTNGANGNRWLMPEKLEEDLKENSGWFLNSAAPVVYAWDFFFLKEDAKNETEAWERRIVLDYQQMQPEGLRAAVESDSKANFLFDSSKRAKSDPIPSWQRLIHWQFGNVSLVSPCRYYSVRSFGYLLFSVCQLQNRLRCRFSDAIFESLLQYFRNVGEDDRERLEKVDLLHMGIVPDGLSFVTKGERWEVNENLALIGLQQNRQLMDEGSASYLPSGGQRAGLTPATATEEVIRANTSAALTSAMLNRTYEGITGLYREVCRRFTLPESKHPLKEKFIRYLIAAGIPQAALPMLLNVEMWNIEPDRVLGGGNKAVEALQADRLMAVRAALDPQAQRLVTYKYVLANSDAQTARMLVPLEGPTPGNSSKDANNAIAPLMMGLPYVPDRTSNPVEYLTVLLQLMEQVTGQVQQLSQTQAQGVEILLADKLAGFFNAVQHAGGLIQQLAQDEMMREPAKMLMQGLETLVQTMAPIAQELQNRMAEAQAQGQQLAPEVQAKIAAITAQAQAKMQIDEAKAKQKMEQKDAGFFAELERRNATTAADIKEQDLRLGSELTNAALKTRAEMLQEMAKARMVRE